MEALNALKKIPENIAPFEGRFPTVFDLDGRYSKGADPRTMRELRMMAFSSEIRSKPNWWEKIKDKTIKSKWIQEAKKQGLSDSTINYAIAELEKYYIPLIDGLVVPSPVDGVYQADQLISNELRAALISEAYKLENVPDYMKDWHPSSNNQVLDLVHPSLYCYVKGVSRVTSGRMTSWYKFLTSGKPEDEADEKDYWRKPGLSAKYQWLPTPFKIDNNGKVTIGSYINNLAPKMHRGLYQAISSIFERFIPLFNKTLTDALHPRPNRLDCTGVFYSSGHDTPSQPEFKEFTEIPPPNEVVYLNGRTVQVIVKMANIILTPDEPQYDGGVWHVEGMENERIIATGIYYYMCENITESRLEFRTSVHEPSNYEQDDSAGCISVFGIGRDDLLVQPIGSIIAQQDRCVVFPNLYQHKVAPFKLVDPNKPGVRKILCFFLVDPATPILSTAQVPPQQMKWIFYEKPFIEGTYFCLLPPEILHMILDLYEDESLEAAKKHREKLMAERKFYVDKNKDRWERPFSLCEH